MTTADSQQDDLYESGPVRGSRAHAAYVETRRRIITLELAPGQTFTEGALAAALGVSKTPVREALGVLAAERYLTVMPQSGYLITPITLRDIHELFETHLVLAGGAVRFASSPRPHDYFAPLTRLLETRPPGDDPDRADEFITSYLEFHLTLTGLCANRRIRPLLARVLHQHERLIRLCTSADQLPGALVGDDRPLLEALQDARWREASEAERVRLGACRDRVLGALVSTDDILDAAIRV